MTKTELAAGTHIIIFLLKLLFDIALLFLFFVYGRVPLFDVLGLTAVPQLFF